MNITTLHYDGNQVENRDHLKWLSQTFPSLCTLVLCECPLWTVRWSSSHSKQIHVSKLVFFLPCSFSKVFIFYQGIHGDDSSNYGSSDSDSSLATCLGDGKSSACCTPFKDCQEQNSSDVLFASVRSVSLNHCHIDCWEELAQLRHWPSLTELRIQSCPLFRVRMFFFKEYGKIDIF